MTVRRRPPPNPSRRFVEEIIPTMLCCICHRRGAVGVEVVPLATRQWVHRLQCHAVLIVRHAARAAGTAA